MTIEAQPTMSAMPYDAGIIDITGQHADLAEGETVYRSVSGYVVKVTACAVAGPGGVHHVRMQGVPLDGAGAPTTCGREHVLSIHAETEVDVQTVVEAARRQVVMEIERSLIHAARIAATRGVKTLA